MENSERNGNTRPPDLLNSKKEKELKSLLIKVKEESEKAGLKLNIQNTMIMASSPITSWEIDGIYIFSLFYFFITDVLESFLLFVLLLIGFHVTFLGIKLAFSTKIRIQGKLLVPYNKVCCIS